MKLTQLTQQQLDRIAQSDEEKRQLKRLLDIEKMMKRLERDKDFHYFGLGNNDTTFGWFKQTLVFHLDVAGDYTMVRSIWTPEAYRGRGLCRQFLKKFYAVAQEENWNTAVVANPFACNRWDLVTKDYEGFHYTKDKKSRDAMAGMISEAGFTEISPAVFHEYDFAELAERVVKDYGSLWPRYFVNQDGMADTDYQFNDKQYQRILDWAERQAG